MFVFDKKIWICMFKYFIVSGVRSTGMRIAIPTFLLSPYFTLIESTSRTFSKQHKHIMYVCTNVHGRPIQCVTQCTNKQRTWSKVIHPTTIVPARKSVNTWQAVPSEKKTTHRSSIPWQWIPFWNSLGMSSFGSSLTSLPMIPEWCLWFLTLPQKYNGWDRTSEIW
jgi:hypothetical protein